ncbi:hypothetical protein K1719_014785 [Acacia pycnantha]|nr:hypothetical protein K1719_014785 [Acacia pycnantha]
MWRRTGKLPQLQVSAEEYDAWCKPFMNSLIVKLLGKSVNVGFMRFRMERMWALKGPMRVTPLNNGYYLVSFSSTADRDFALQEGPWMIADHYLLVKRWRPNFNPWRADSQKRVAVWVRIPDLPHELYNVESIRIIGNMIGKTLKIDRTTAFSEKGGFARMCVEIDLQRPLLPGFCHFGEERRFEFEGLHLVCFTCGRYGHRTEQCVVHATSQEPASSSCEPPVVNTLEPERKGEEQGLPEGSPGKHQRVEYGPQMLVKRDFRKTTVRTEVVPDQSAMAMKTTRMEQNNLNATQESRDPSIKEKMLEKKLPSGEEELPRRFGADIQNKYEDQVWTHVGSKRKAGIKGGTRGKENKLGIKGKPHGKGKVTILGPDLVVTSSEFSLLNGPKPSEITRKPGECNGPLIMEPMDVSLQQQESLDGPNGGLGMKNITVGVQPGNPENTIVTLEKGCNNGEANIQCTSQGNRLEIVDANMIVRDDKGDELPIQQRKSP